MTESQPFIPVIAFVGGVGSGKSTVTRTVAELSPQPILVIDGDRTGHHVLTLPKVQSQLRNRFGDGIFDETEAVHRSSLARLVFGDAPKQRAALADLERITHPVIRSEFARQIEAFRAGDASGGSPAPTAILLDAAVLLESGWGDLCDAIVFIDTPETERIARVENRGWTADELRRREASQMPLSEKRERADLIVPNTGDPTAAAREVLALIERLRSELNG